MDAIVEDCSSLMEKQLSQKKLNCYFFSADEEPLCLPELKHAEQTPDKPLNHPRQKCQLQASLPQCEHFLPSSGSNFAPQIAQVKGTMPRELLTISIGARTITKGFMLTQ